MPSILSSIFGAFFGSGRQSGPPRRTLPGLEVFDERTDGSLMFEYKNRLYGGGRRSPDGRYLAGASDGQSRAGQVILLDLLNGEVAFRKALKRPQNPWVSDDGVVYVEN